MQSKHTPYARKIVGLLIAAWARQHDGTRLHDAVVGTLEHRVDEYIADEAPVLIAGMGDEVVVFGSSGVDRLRLSAPDRGDAFGPAVLEVDRLGPLAGVKVTEQTHVGYDADPDEARPVMLIRHELLGPNEVQIALHELDAPRQEAFRKILGTWLPMK